MDVATISILAIIIGCIIGLAEWTRLMKNDAGTMAAQIRTLETKINYLEEQLGQLKKDEESVEVTVRKAIEEKIINEKILSILQEKLSIQDSILK